MDPANDFHFMERACSIGSFTTTTQSNWDVSGEETESTTNERCEEMFTWSFQCYDTACEDALLSKAVDMAYATKNIVNKTQTTAAKYYTRVCKDLCDDRKCVDRLKLNPLHQPGDCDPTTKRGRSRKVVNKAPCQFDENTMVDCWIPAGRIKRADVHEGYDCGNEDCLKVFDPAVELELHNLGRCRTVMMVGIILLGIAFTCCCGRCCYFICSAPDEGDCLNEAEDEEEDGGKEGVVSEGVTPAATTAKADSDSV
jgi:hypothetical protein